MSLILSLLISISSFAAVDYKLQKNHGFIGYIPAGVDFTIKKISFDQRVMTVTVPSDEAAGNLQVTFKNFERALNRGKVEYLDKREPLVGQSFTLTNNVLLLPVK